MIGAVIAIGIGAYIVKKLDDKADYKQPKGKHKDRYK